MDRLPLDGIRVLEIAAYISGPYAGALLASAGADVVKIEPPAGDAFRIGKGVGSPYFAQYNAGKRSVAIDLKSPAAVNAIKSLLPHFDVLIENMRPGKLEALGLGVGECQRINPQLVYTSISGFGNGGPLRDRPAYDSIGQSIGGLYTIMNDEHDVRLTGTCVADLITAISTTLGVLTALVGRSLDNKRKGIELQTSVFEAMSTLTIDAMTQAFDLGKDPVRNTRHPQANNFCLRTASSEYVTLHLSSSQKFWRALLRAVAREDLIEDPRFRTYQDRTVPENYRVLVEILEQEFAKHSYGEWERRLSDADVPFAQALTMRQLAEHPQTQWLQMFDRSENLKVLLRLPWKLDGARPHRPGHVPSIGEHTRQVLAEVMSEGEIDELAASNAIFVPGTLT